MAGKKRKTRRPQPQLSSASRVPQPRLVTLLADQQYPNHALDAWRAAQRTGWRLEVQPRPASIPGFPPLEKRWVIARTNAWHGRYRRHSKD